MSLQEAGGPGEGNGCGGMRRGTGCGVGQDTLLCNCIGSEDFPA